jgi:hypothetical protein
MQYEALVLDMRVFVDVIHPLGVKQRRAPLDAVYLVSLIQQELGKITAVLASNASDKGFFHRFMLTFEGEE